jgi:hypothetical protein
LNEAIGGILTCFSCFTFYGHKTEVLHISENEIGGTIPEEIGRLTLLSMSQISTTHQDTYFFILHCS